MSEHFCRQMSLWPWILFLFSSLSTFQLHELWGVLLRSIVCETARIPSGGRLDGAKHWISACMPYYFSQIERRIFVNTIFPSQFLLFVIYVCVRALRAAHCGRYSSKIFWSIECVWCKKWNTNLDFVLICEYLQNSVSGDANLIFFCFCFFKSHR